MDEKKQIEAPQLATMLPSAPEAEKALLRNILISPEVYFAIRDTVIPDDFTVIKYRNVYQCMKEAADDNVEISMVSICSKAESKHLDIKPIDLAEISAYMDGGDDFMYLAQVLNSIRVRRQMWMLFQKASSKALSFSSDIGTVIEEVRKNLDDIQSVGREHIVSFDDSCNEVNRIMQGNQDPNTARHGTMIGFDWFDTRGGFQKSDLVVVAAESSQGKTSFALSASLNVMLRGDRVAYYSLEMSHVQLTARLLSMQSGVSSLAILNQPLSDIDIEAVRNGFCVRNGCNSGMIYFDDRPLSSIDPIISSIRTTKMKQDISGAVVDFLQRLSPPRGMSKEQFIGEASQKFKNLARELDIWIMLLSQLSRDRETPVPNLNRLRDSGQINEAADITILLYRPEAVVPYSPTRAFPAPFADYDTTGNAMVTIAKGRNIGTGAFLCGFDATRTRFYEKPIQEIPSTFCKKNNDDPFQQL